MECNEVDGAYNLCVELEKLLMVLPKVVVMCFSNLGPFNATWILLIRKLTIQFGNNSCPQESLPHLNLDYFPCGLQDKRDDMYNHKR